MELITSVHVMCLFSLIFGMIKDKVLTVYSCFMDYHLVLTSYTDKFETISINHLSVFIFNIIYTKYQIFKK